MKLIWRIVWITTLVSSLSAAVALARPVYLKDGGVIQAQKVWKEDGRIYVLVNRDSLIFFSPEEVNLGKTFAKGSRPAASTSKPKVAAPSPTPQPVKSVSSAPATPAPTAAQVAAPSPPQVKQSPPAPQKNPPQATVAPPKQATAAPAPVPPPPPKKAVVRPPPPPPEPEGFEALGETVVLGIFAGVAAFCLLLVASFWKIFVKAGEAGWKSLVPFYNFIVLLQIAGCPTWWFLMMLIPVVQLYFMVVMHLRLAEQFGKSHLFGFGLCFLGFIFFPILAFGPATYGTFEKEAFTFDEVG